MVVKLNEYTVFANQSSANFLSRMKVGALGHAPGHQM